MVAIADDMAAEVQPVVAATLGIEATAEARVLFQKQKIAMAKTPSSGQSCQTPSNDHYLMHHTPLITLQSQLATDP
jgi:hypothetical protein